MKHHVEQIILPHILVNHNTNKKWHFCEFIFFLPFTLYRLRVWIVSTYFTRNFPKTFPAPCRYKFKIFDVGVFEFVPLLDDKVQEKFLENFSGGSDGQSKWKR